MEEIALDAYPALPIAVNVEPELNVDAVKVFEWKLLKTAWTKSIFTKKKMKERIDINLIYGFIKSEMGISYQGCSRYDGIPCEIKTELDQIKYLRNQYDKKQKIIKMAHCLPKHKWGRTIPIGYSSLSVLHRPTRHRLSEKEYIDIDIVNCQPQLIQEICKQRGIKVEALEKYCRNPKKYRAYVAEYHDCDKDTAKQLFVRLMFGGTYNKWIKDFDIQKNENNRYKLPHDIEGEMGAIIDAVYTANPHIAKDVLKQNPKKWVNEGEKKRGVMGLWSQTLERRIMEDSIWFLHENKQFVVEDVVPCQDGLMILKDLYYDDILKDLGKNILDKYGFNIEFVVKPFDESIEIPAFEDVKSYDEWVDCLSSKRLADHLVVMKGDHIINNKGVYVFYNGRWYNETNERERNRLTIIVSEDLYEDRKSPIQDAVELTEDEVDSLLKTLRTNTSNGAIFKDIIRHALAIQAGKHNHIKFDERKDLLGFENGVIELPTGNFRPYEYSDYITLTTLYEYHPPDYTKEEVKKLRKEIEGLMQSIQDKPDHLELLYQILCSGLDANAYELFFFFNGRGGNGKGLIGKLMRCILGDNFAYSPKESLFNSLAGEGASPDVADLQYKRYVGFCEMGGVIKARCFKKLTGGDKMTARQLYNNNSGFEMHSTNIGEFNNPPDFDEKLGDSIARRAVDFGFTNNYTTDPNRIGKTINGISYKEANEYYNTSEFVGKASPILLDILLEKYRKYWDISKKQIVFIIPDDIRRATTTLLNTMDIFHRLINAEWEVNDDSKKVSGVELWTYIKNSDDYRGLPSRTKKQYSREAFYEWLGENYIAEQDHRKSWWVNNIKRKGDTEVEVETGT